MLKKSLCFGLLFCVSMAVGSTRERLKEKLAQRKALRSVMGKKQETMEESKKSSDSRITIALPVNTKEVSTQDVKILVQQALLNKSIEIQAKSLSVSLRHLIDLGADYNRTHSPADKIRFSFAVRNSWANAFLFFWLLRQRKISKEVFCDVYIKPLKNRSAKELNELANLLSRGGVNIQSIGATLCLFYQAVELYYSNKPKTMQDFIDEIYKEIDSCESSLQGVMLVRNVHHALAEETTANIENLKELFKKYGSTVFNESDMYGYSPIHYAAFFNNMSALKLLLESGCCANVTDKEGTLPLLLASDAKVVEFIKSKTNIDTPFADGKTALLLACQSNSICKPSLVSFKARADICDDRGDMPLHFLSDQYLKKYASSIDQKNILTSKIKAAKSGNLEALDKTFSIEKVLNINIDNTQALEEAEKQLELAKKSKDKPREDWMEIIIKALEQAELETLKGVFSRVESEVKVWLESEKTKKSKITPKEKSVSLLELSPHSINTLTVAPSLLQETQRSAQIVQALEPSSVAVSSVKEKNVSLKPKKLTGTQRRQKQRVLALQQEQERAARREEKKRVWEQEQEVNKRADDFAQTHAIRRTINAWHKYAHEQKLTLTQLEKQVQTNHAKKQTKTLFTLWREEQGKKRQEKIAQQKRVALMVQEKANQQRLKDQQAAERFSQELAADQNNQRLHGIIPTHDAHEWWIQHMRPIVKTLSDAAAIPNVDLTKILHAACATCAERKLITLTYK